MPHSLEVITLARSIPNNFYRSKKWITFANYIRESRNYTCDRCGGYGNICHHIIHLNMDNYNNPTIAFNEELIELLCYNCHNKEHMHNNTTQKDMWFDKDGNIHHTSELNNDD